MKSPMRPRTQDYPAKAYSYRADFDSYERRLNAAVKQIEILEKQVRELKARSLDAARDLRAKAVIA